MFQLGLDKVHTPVPLKIFASQGLRVPFRFSFRGGLRAGTPAADLSNRDSSRRAGYEPLKSARKRKNPDLRTPQEKSRMGRNPRRFR